MNANAKEIYKIVQLKSGTNCDRKIWQMTMLSWQHIICGEMQSNNIFIVWTIGETHGEDWNSWIMREIEGNVGE